MSWSLAKWTRWGPFLAASVQVSFERQVHVHIPERSKCGGEVTGLPNPCDQLQLSLSLRTPFCALICPLPPPQGRAFGWLSSCSGCRVPGLGKSFVLPVCLSVYLGQGLPLWPRLASNVPLSHCLKCWDYRGDLSTWLSLCLVSLCLYLCGLFSHSDPPPSPASGPSEAL